MLKVIVVSMDTRTGDAHDLRSELSLTRSAALYADHVVLLSPYEGIVEQIADGVVGRTSVSPSAMVEALRSERPDLYEALLAEREPDVLLRTLMATVQMHAEVPEAASALEEIGRGKASGFLSTLNATEDATPGSLVAATTDRLFDLVMDPSIHVVCDAKSARLIRRLAEDGDERAPTSFLRRSREAELGAGLIARLPAFPTAPLPELLAVKTELEGPVQRFRAAVGRLERDLPQEALGADLDSEISAVWRVHVAPALVELEEALVEHSFTREIARAVGRSARDVVLAGAALSVAAANIAQVAASVSAAAGFVGASVQVVASAALDYLSQRRAATKADFFYLQELSRRIDKAGA